MNLSSTPTSVSAPETAPAAAPTAMPSSGLRKIKPMSAPQKPPLTSSARPRIGRPSPPTTGGDNYRERQVAWEGPRGLRRASGPVLLREGAIPVELCAPRDFVYTIRNGQSSARPGGRLNAAGGRRALHSP